MTVKLILATVCCFFHAVTSDVEAVDEPTCRLYLAPSFTPGIGRGVFAGTSFQEGEDIDNSVTLVFHREAIGSWQLGNYDWQTKEAGVSMAELGAGMLFNHRNPATVEHKFQSHVKLIDEQRLAHTTYSTALNTAMRDIRAGEELFVSYSKGNDWLEQRGIKVDNSHTNETYVPPTRSATELDQLGVCLTDIEVKKSLIPFAGKGIFAARDFKEGDLVTISPTVVLPKGGVVNIDRTVIQNYCIASPEVANIVFFPFGVGAVANHAKPGDANMRLEWYWWNEEEKEKKMSSTADDLSMASFVQLDIGYRATRDIFEGEELTYDYGEKWAEAWASHISSLNQWYSDSAIRDAAENDHIPPDQFALGSERPKFLYFIASEHLFLPHWKAESAALVAEAEREAERLAAEALVDVEAEGIVGRVMEDTTLTDMESVEAENAVTK